MAYDPRRWAGGLALAGLAWIVGAWWETPRVEADLARRGAQALGAKWLDKPGVTVSGRDVSLSGAAFTALSAETAADAVQSVWGVRLVNDDATTLIPPASPYVWSARRKGAKLSLAGDAPDPDARAAILAAAKAIEGAELADRMTYARGRSAGLTAGAAFALGELALMPTGAADLADGALTLSGAAADSDAYLRAVAALARPPDGVTLAKADIVPPLAKPFVFSAASGQGTLELTGEAPSIAARDAIAADAKAAFPDAKIEDALSIASGAPAGDFAADAKFALTQLAALASGKAALSDSDFSLEGVAASDAAADAAEAAVAALPQGLKLAVFGVERPAPAPEPPPAPAVVAPAPSGPPLDVDACQDEFKRALDSARIKFETASATISPASGALLQTLAAIALRCQSGRIEISGHADDLGDDATNDQLAKARAEAVLAYFVAAGVPADRLTAVGYGASRPVASNDTEEGRAQNRRIEFSVKE
ncbi:MAG: OmpA family protein [Roseiarcus sp.]|jgi:OOP family OmpA-OmpF porin